MNVFITGANRGIGLGFVHYYLQQGARVWASYRSDAGELADIKSDRLHTVMWNVGSDDGPVGELPDSIDLLINNAGIYGPKKDGQTLENITSTAMLDVFNIDCIGPLRVVQALRQPLVNGKAVIANLSSKMGSSTDNSSGGTYAYRAAKAALVIISKSMAVDLAPFGMQVITLHPGWVTTDMTNHTGLIDVETSVSGMSAVIASARDYPGGAFIAFDGKIVPY